MVYQESHQNRINNPLYNNPKNKNKIKYIMARTKATTKKTATNVVKKAKNPSCASQPQLKMIKNDPYLEPFSDAINGRYQAAINKKIELVGEKGNLNDFASGYLYFGLHKTEDTWILREWAPNAIDIFVVGDFNDWKESAKGKSCYYAY